MNIGIVGLGLIGGSLALDLRELNHYVLGVSRQAETCTLAQDLGVVDQASVDLSILTQAEIVILATPIAAIAPTLIQLIPHLSPHTIVTDVGSVKVSVVQTCSQLWHNFIGGHPMAGNIKQGINAAQKGLFQGASYVITPIAQNTHENVEKLADLATSVGAKVYYCSPEHHDQAVAWISHLPVCVSASLIDACLQETIPEVSQLARQLASSGFRDTSRVGGGNVELGVMMARYNREQILRAIASYQNSLTAITEYIQQENWSALTAYLEKTQQARPDFLRD
ncbi:prephenate/arogenate dehydrogenase [Gloeocapsa sp. PCC 73106]|uniref:prephenate/arogenate dehydrogenase n=1 Tax=Gloeocapsa sp. PCC 73106 TaxID=102232 RepID=UPI0002ABC2B9|nr:prephenate/arogenate dehydrogenase [Gloeocapsa sp. PCC 73106]ELR99979.1 prephenate dehydrogenase [Gloeocapsa sp. PCC 73106]